MTRLQALKELARKVEAGEEYATMGHTLLCSRAFPKPDDFTGSREAYAKSDAQMAILAWRNGSLDAAQALHEALLAGWSPVIDICVPCVDMYCEIKDDVSISTGEWEWMFQVSTDANPARSWLLAILKALIAQEETDT